MALESKTKLRIAQTLLATGAFLTGFWIREAIKMSKLVEAEAKKQLIYSRIEQIDPIRFKEEFTIRGDVSGNLFVIRHEGDCVTNSFTIRTKEVTGIDLSDLPIVARTAVRLEMDKLIAVCRDKTGNPDTSTSFK